jgi:signal-transduction protein with cAMP-binding, CBS, and nucleotidyltransferase domain
VRLTVVSKTGKEATIGIVSEGNFFGEGALAGQLQRRGSAAAMTDCELLRVEKKVMMGALHREHAFPDMFVAYLPAPNIGYYEQDLVDQLFYSSAMRLARVLRLLAHFGKEAFRKPWCRRSVGGPCPEMIGTTCSRVSFL